MAKTTRMYYFTIKEARSPKGAQGAKIKVSAGMLSSEGSMEESVPCLFQLPEIALVYGPIPSASAVISHSSPLTFLHSYYKDPCNFVGPPG